MGMICPDCGTWQAIKQNITIDGLGAKKASDVVAQRLACGHVLGGKKYTEFAVASRKADVEAADNIRKINEELASEKASLWKSMSDSKKVGVHNAK